jgi:hypothetical protein
MDIVSIDDDAHRAVEHAHVVALAALDLEAPGKRDIALEPSTKPVVPKNLDHVAATSTEGEEICEPPFSWMMSAVDPGFRATC